MSISQEAEMSKHGSLDALKKAFEEGYNAFKVYPIPDNPYSKNSLTYKEWIRGHDRGYFENQKVAK